LRFLEGFSRLMNGIFQEILKFQKYSRGKEEFYPGLTAGDWDNSFNTVYPFL
jgi:hypothetical protein